FESGFTSWTRVDQLGSEGTFALQSGTTSPVNGVTVPAPPGGLNAAMSDAAGPGAHVLYQDFVVSALVSSVSLDFDLFLKNGANDFLRPDTLDFGTPALNQEAGVDILLASAGPFSLLPADLLMNVFKTNPGDTFSSSYVHHEIDITSLLNAHVGSTLRVRI